MDEEPGPNEDEDLPLEPEPSIITISPTELSGAGTPTTISIAAADEAAAQVALVEASVRCGGQTVAAWEDLADHLAYCWVLPCSAALQYCGTASPVVAGRASSILAADHDSYDRQTFS